jgi:hypothetical protein
MERWTDSRAVGCSRNMRKDFLAAVPGHSVPLCAITASAAGCLSLRQSVDEPEAVIRESVNNDTSQYRTDVLRVERRS